jgi:hypothetical protein
MMTIIEYTIAVMEKIGVCDACLARLRKLGHLDMPMSEMLCDKCLAKDAAYLYGMSCGDPACLKIADDAEASIS